MADFGNLPGWPFLSPYYKIWQVSETDTTDRISHPPSMMADENNLV
jgi:hypothetical protein